MAARALGADDDHAWRVERACAAAWPAREAVEIAGWRIACSGGGTRRINSASPVDAAARCDESALSAIRTAYASAGLPAIVRVPAMLGSADAWLDRNAFAAAEGHTQTIACATLPIAPAATAALTRRPDTDWLAARRRLSLAAGLDGDYHVAPIARLATPALFAAVSDAGAIRSLAFAAVQGGIAIVEAVATDPAWRGRGLALRCLSALLHATASLGAREAALQVQADNEPARALYRRLGFARHLYDYHYRRSPA